MKNMILLYIILGVIASIVIFVVLKRIGLIKSRQAKERSDIKQGFKTAKLTATRDITQATALSTNYWKQKNFNETDKLNAGKKAEGLRKSMRFWGTRDSTLFGIISSIKSKSELSLVSFMYQKMYNRSLAADITSDLNKADEARLYEIIKKLPNE